MPERPIYTYSKSPTNSTRVSHERRLLALSYREIAAAVSRGHQKTYAQTSLPTHLCRHLLSSPSLNFFSLPSFYERRLISFARSFASPFLETFREKPRLNEGASRVFTVRRINVDGTNQAKEFLKVPRAGPRDLILCRKEHI